MTAKNFRLKRTAKLSPQLFLLRTSIYESAGGNYEFFSRCLCSFSILLSIRAYAVTPHSPLWLKSAAKTIYSTEATAKLNRVLLFLLPLMLLETRLFKKVSAKYYIFLNMIEAMVLGIINQQPFFQYSMTSNQIATYSGIEPTLESVAQDVSQLDRDSLLKLQEYIQHLLEPPIILAASVPETEPEQANPTEAKPSFEYLELLKLGVTVWNEWREKHPDVYIDLSKANLSGANLQLANLSKVNLESANLSNADLRGAFLREANLQGAILFMADLVVTNLQNVCLQKANLQGADLYKANLGKADLREANLMQANIRRANLLNANLEAANLQEADLLEAKLMQANLSRADLQKANLERTNLIEASLEGAILVAAKLCGANACRANLTRADIYRANLYNTTLKGAIMPDGTIHH